MSKRRLFGVIAIMIGVVVPIVIDEIETANHLDISRDVGSLPWVILGIIGVILVVWSVFEKPSQ